MKRRLEKREENIFSDINVTPLVDVTLVLLIIFMITAPFIFQGIKVSLPRVIYGRVVKEQSPIVITIDARRRIFVKNQQVSLKKLYIKLKSLGKVGGRKVIFKCDRRVPYGYAVKVLSVVKKAGFEEVGIAVEKRK